LSTKAARRSRGLDGIGRAGRDKRENESRDGETREPVDEPEAIDIGIMMGARYVDAANGHE
jgi:hypothetical protein